MNSIYNYTLKDLQEYFESVGETKFRASQVFDWLYIKRVKSFDEMTNLKKTLIEFLKKSFSCKILKLVKKYEETLVKIQGCAATVKVGTLMI